MPSHPVHDVARIFESAKAHYAVIGGHAVNVWLEPRFTADIDFTVSIDAEGVQNVREAFDDAGYQVEREHGAAQASGPDFLRLVSGDGSVIVEIQFAKTALQHELISRACTDRLGARIATAEDLIVLKLIAHRGKDRVDLEGLAALPDIDWTYVERWCREWQILDRLEQLRGAKE